MASPLPLPRRGDSESITNIRIVTNFNKSSYFRDVGKPLLGRGWGGLTL